MKQAVKQVIVVRKDLKMRAGKAMAQACHASTAILLNEMSYDINNKKTHLELTIKNEDPLAIWLEDKFTKVVVSVDDLQELYDVYNAAKRAKLRTVMITDAGLTEFNGIPTETCIAIGPNFATEIDKITGSLKLL